MWWILGILAVGVILTVWCMTGKEANKPKEEQKEEDKKFTIVDD